jgi:hypothetical protein
MAGRAAVTGGAGGAGRLAGQRGGGPVRVSRQSVYAWKARHAAAGVDGLREASRQPRTSPSRLAAEAEALCASFGGRIRGGVPAGSPLS